jgi:hypothetical protein
VAAVVFRATLPAHEAVARIAELADARPNMVAGLEGLVALLGSGLAEDALAPALRERVGEAIRRLSTTPGTGFAAFHIPDDPEEAYALFAAQSGRDAEATEAIEGMRQAIKFGGAPVAFLAHMTGRDIGETWMRIGFLPIGFADPHLDQLELREATKALDDQAAVWDIAAFVVAGGLGLADAALTAMPGSLLSYATLADADRGGVVLPADEGARAEVVPDPIRRRIAIVETPEAEVERDNARARGVAELARRPTPPQAVDERLPAPLDEFFAREETQTGPLREWRDAMLLAKQSGLRLYSDDRFVRNEARRLGIHAFGTIALTRALEAQGRLPSGEASALTERLRASSALGVPVSTSELLAMMETDGFRAAPRLLRAVSDPTVCRLADDLIFRTLAILRFVYQRCPERFEEWTARIVDCIRVQAPLLRPPPSVLLTFALAEEAQRGLDGDFTRALTAALRSASAIYGFDIYDPLPSAIDRVVSALGQDDRELRSRVYTALLPLLGDADRALIHSLRWRLLPRDDDFDPALAETLRRALSRRARAG